MLDYAGIYKSFALLEKTKRLRMRFDPVATAPGSDFVESTSLWSILFTTEQTAQCERGSPNNIAPLFLTRCLTPVPTRNS